MSSCIKHETDELGIVTITLNRPEAANALSRHLLMELKELLHGLSFETSIRCIVITGEGEKAFCAGADLRERATMNVTEVKQTVALIGECISSIEKLPHPVIASINGAAFGGGLELALACDIRIAGEGAKMGLTETSLGIIPGAGGTQRLPRLIGIPKAKELIYTAKRISAIEAENLGLVNHAVPDEELSSETRRLAMEIAKNAPIALQQAKKAINQGMQTDLTTGIKIEELCYGVTIPTKDRLEGLQAFKEKRQPVYKGE
ncbi:enoyl-CoA hydratase [Peribacillus alkalitolerans]|uniref:enoyl-CoA hydratase n=1 Tax=Peribacillus alkalitolerans TaxID=1550385 RepID=UPI0013D4E9DF|nr:enoyl-CoA hydratase [Peribacillus alkalitolerans]